VGWEIVGLSRQQEAETHQAETVRAAAV